ncbi:hypothetical protein JTE90_016400, partial [Oedothorax gibbosus]
PLGESYGRTEPFNAELYDNPNHRKVSSYSLFGDGYFSLINKHNQHNSVDRDNVDHQSSNNTTLNHPRLVGKRGSTASEQGHDSNSQAVPSTAHNRRHRPSAIAGHVLTSVSEMDQEESEDPSPTRDLKMALAFLDEDDPGEIVTEK